MAAPVLALWLATAMVAVAPATVPEPAEVAGTTIIVLRIPPGVEVDAAGYHAAIEDHARSVGVPISRAAPSDARPLVQALQFGKDPDTLGVFWLEAHPDRLAVYLYEPRAQGVFIREIARGEDDEAALIESLGLILASTAVALRDGQHMGMRPVDDAELAKLQPDPEPEPESASPPKEPKRASPVEPEPESAPPTRGRVRVGAAYLGDGLGGSAPWQSGARVLVSVAVHPNVRLGAGYGFVGPGRFGTTPPTLRLLRHDVMLDAGFGAELGDGVVSLHGVLIAGISLAQWSTSGTDGLRPLARVGPMFEVGVRLVAGLVLDIGLGATAALNRFDFVVCDRADTACTGDAREPVVSAWRVAPRATLGLSYRFGAKKSAD